MKKAPYVGTKARCFCGALWEFLGSCWSLREGACSCNGKGLSEDLRQ